MSLQVWLPLNGDLHNQGLTNVTLNSGTPTYSAGKIGQCLSNGTLVFDIGDSLISNKLGVSNIYSMCCWCKNLNASTGSRWVFYIGSGAGGCRGLWESNSTASRHWAYSGSGNNIPMSINSIDGQWHHIAFISNSTNVKLYIDGIYQGEINYGKTDLLNTNILTLSANNYLLNDFRLYDHCLSPKEVAEIAKGLCLHYKLTGGNNKGNPNYLYNSGPNSNSLNSWSVAGSGWSNSIVSCESAPFGYAVRSTYTGTGGTSGGIHHPPTTLNGTASSKTDLINGETYTLSGYLRASKNCTVTFRSEMMSGPQSQITTEWKKYSFTGTVNTSASYYSNVFYVSASEVTTNMWIEAYGWKLEKGDKATGWTPHPMDAIYASMGYGENIEYDCSGFGKHGIISNVGLVENSSPRYSVALNNNGQLYITMPSITLDKTYSISLWLKPNSSMTDWQRIFNIGDNSTNRTGLCYGNNGTQIGYHNRYNDTMLYDYYALTYTPNTWYYYCVTCSGNQIKQYINGNLVHTGNLSTPYNGMTYSMGTLYRMYNSGNANACLSDFRIYATTLTADQVKELYEVGGSVAKGDTVWAYEYNE